MASLESQKLSPTEETEVQQWITTSERLKASPSDASILDKLNSHLTSRTTLLGTKPSKADVAIYESLAPAVKAWTPEQRTGEHGHPHILRHLDFVQNSGVFGLSVNDAEKVKVDLDEVLYVKPPVDAKAEKERLKKEKAAAAAAAAGTTGEGGVAATIVDRTKAAAEAVKDAAVDVKDKAAAAVGAGAGAEKPKKEKKEKAPKQPKAPAVATPPAPHLIDLRVGHILKAIKHPEADSLFVSTIAMGDKPGTDDTEEYEGQVCRTVCSGLNGLIPLEDMQNRKVVVVANLKPVKMRGIKSCAMVLAASPKLKEGEVDDHKGPVELVTPPADAKAGDRVCFEGWRGEPEGVLNPKKKVWETFQPGFTTTDSLEVVFDGHLVKEAGKEEVGKLTTASGGICTVQTLKGATVR
ncbi:nucleic acid-binding protein [Hypoxylon fragiforme]|uniref:nucleic acid-binding protein n=1 Tax=Hypoxylon fragiforme TaxID=63214 RepID=UPI0020C693DE|nr:nucleic acid-binding protein [Hypoxylon fragiforme]KAI2606912.1 nucleic acid-binding protein [Hypoxylon fragiforme]